MSEVQNFEKQRETLLQTLMPVIVLTIICALAGGSLAAIKELTTPQIEYQLLTNVQGPTLKKLFPNADEEKMLEERKIFTDKTGKNFTVFPVYEFGKFSAVAIEGIGQGYGGDLGIMVGFNLSNDTMRNVGVTISKETPGIGSKVALPRYTKQFIGKSGKVALRSDGGDIDAEAGATISSKAAVVAVQQAILAFEELKPEILQTWSAQQQ